MHKIIKQLLSKSTLTREDEKHIKKLIDLMKKIEWKKD